MGKKVNPKILRIGTINSWPSAWYAEKKKYITNIKQDVSIRRFLLKNYKEAGIGKVEISRNSGKINIDIFTAKPGLIIGRGGNGIEELKKKIHRTFLKKFRPHQINLNVKEVSRANLTSQIIVQSMTTDLEKRIPFRKVLKQNMSKIEKAGALGAKIVVAGRLNGSEIARTERMDYGKIPLQTLRADIDYARGVAKTTYGTIGVKVWIYKGEVFEEENTEKGQIVGGNK